MYDPNNCLTLISTSKSLPKNFMNVGKLFLRNLYVSLNMNFSLKEVMNPELAWQLPVKKEHLMEKVTKRSATYSIPVESILLFKLEFRFDEDILCPQCVSTPNRLYR